MSLGQGIGEMWEAVRDRVEVSGDEPTWYVTAGSFDSALTYARARFDDPVVLARHDRTRWWPRVTLTVTTDPALATEAPALEDMARPPVPEQRAVAAAEEVTATARTSELPTSLEAIFAHQEELRLARQRVPYHDSTV
jgi:hypothetical protein